MSFAGLLGAGLLGGVSNAAKGIGDRLREEAKQKRAEALQDRAEKKAQALAKTANDNAVKAATQLQIHQARRDRINNAALIKRDNNNAFNQAASQDDQQEFTGGQNDATRTQQVDLQNDQQDFTDDQRSKAHADAMEVAGIKNSDTAKPLTHVQVQSYMNSLRWKFLDGKVDKHGEQLPLSPKDSKIAARWGQVGSAKIQALREQGIPITPAVVDRVVAETFVRPFDVTTIKLTPADRAVARKLYESKADPMVSDNKQFGMSEDQIKRQWATENATRRQPGFIKAQEKYDAYVEAGTDPSDVFDMMRDLGFDPDLLVKKAAAKKAADKKAAAKKAADKKAADKKAADKKATE